MHYFIDGYNLLFRIVRGEGDVTQRRQQLILELHHKIRLIELDATLVFDAQYYPGGSEKTHFDNLEIIFSSAGETADQLILDALHQAENPLDETVVTSDKKLAWYARRRSAKTLPVEEFMVLLNRRYRNKLRQLKPKAVLPDKLSNPKRPQAIKVEEGSMEFYLRTFEEEYKKIETEKPKKKMKEAKVEKEPVTEQPVSDLERWVKAFERKLEQDKDDDFGA